MAQSFLSGSDREKFIATRPKDNFYQTSAFFPMPFALVTTVNEDGQTGIGPHALVFPFGIAERHSMLLISRSTSGTARNLRRTGRCALNFIEFDREALKTVTLLGIPGQSAEEKRKESDFTLIDSPVAENAGDEKYPKILQNAYQVFECTWDRSIALTVPGKSDSQEAQSHFVLAIDDILLKKRLHDMLEEGAGFPSAPIFYGFRNGTAFWFAEHGEPFAITIPENKGTPEQAVLYLANRLDDVVRFTPEACRKLTGIPRPFLKAALTDIIERAKRHGASLIDAELIDHINEERKRA